MLEFKFDYGLSTFIIQAFIVFVIDLTTSVDCFQVIVLNLHFGKESLFWVWGASQGWNWHLIHFSMILKH